MKKIFLATAIMACCHGAAVADAFPSRPVTLVNPYPAGEMAKRLTGDKRMV